MLVRSSRTAAIPELRFDKLDGIVPVVTIDASDGTVLMQAFMNREAWERTIRDGYAHYYSRSRRALWKKGETSGHLQKIVEIRIDCDDDAVLLRVEQVGGVACHTGFRTCFHRRLTVDGLETVGRPEEPETDAADEPPDD
jgi:phosphoribosyl-AMP cyclohydrolase